MNKNEQTKELTDKELESVSGGTKASNGVIMVGMLAGAVLAGAVAVPVGPTSKIWVK